MLAFSNGHDRAAIGGKTAGILRLQGKRMITIASRSGTRSLLSALCGVAAVAIAASAAAAGQRLQHAHGFVLLLGDGLSASATPTGFIIIPENGGDIREPIEVHAEVVAPPLPDGLQSCWFLEPALQCSWLRSEDAGSSGEPVMLTVYAPFGDKFVRYRQLKHADGYEPSFDILEWLKAGDVTVEQSR